jgi:hypothetical protein
MVTVDLFAVSVRFRTLPSRGWTEPIFKGLKTTENQLAQNVLLSAAGNK